MGQADPILTRLNAGPAVKKLVETALVLSNSQDAQQRNHAYSFMESAIKELEDDKEYKLEEEEKDVKSEKVREEEHDDAEKDHDALKILEEEDDNDDKKVREEELSNNNTGGRTTGSEQSTHNTEPYPGEGKDTTDGEKPMQDLSGAINQWSETNGMPPPPQPGMPPGQPGAGQGMPQPPGLAPDIAREMGMIMPQIPPMDSNQMMRQMQYTVNDIMRNYHRKEIAPLHGLMKQQKESLKQHKRAIKALSLELREAKSHNGTMKLDLDAMRQNAPATFRETTESPLTSPMYQGRPLSGIQPQPSRKKEILENARSEITEMDKIIRSSDTTTISLSPFFSWVAN